MASDDVYKYLTRAKYHPLKMTNYAFKMLLEDAYIATK